MEEVLQQEINQAIEKNLPTQVGTVLKQTLEDYEKLKDSYAILKTNYDTLLAEAKAEHAKLAEAGNLSDRETAVGQREDEITKRERNLDKTLLQKDKDCADAQVILMRENFNTVFRNVDIVRNKVGQLPFKEHYPDGQAYTRTETVDMTETESKD